MSPDLWMTALLLTSAPSLTQGVSARPFNYCCTLCVCAWLNWHSTFWYQDTQLSTDLKQSPNVSEKEDRWFCNSHDAHVQSVLARRRFNKNVPFYSKLFPVQLKESFLAQKAQSSNQYSTLLDHTGKDSLKWSASMVIHIKAYLKPFI